MSSDATDWSGADSEARLRKDKSIRRLQGAGVRILETLPMIETVAESLRRKTDEVSVRALALATVAVKGEADGVEGPESVREFISELIEEFQLSGAFTSAEQEYIDTAEPSDHDRVQFTWRYESYWTLLWALGFVEQLDEPSSICDPATAMGVMREHGRQGFLDAAELRPQSQILDEADLIYRYDWAVVNARLAGEAVEGLDAGVVVERHHTLNWLIGYQEQAWDDISTDT